MTDQLTHGRKTYTGADLSFGASVTTPCGKRRPRERTSTDPAEVTCLYCRTWYATEAREIADMARAAADIARQHPGLTAAPPGDFTETARAHDARAEQWR